MANNQNNPFANNPFADAFKAFGDFNPSSGYKEGLANSRKSIEAAVAIAQVQAEGAQAFARKAVEIARGNAQDAIDFWKDLSGSKNPEAGASKQAEFAKKSLEKNLNNSRELFEIASKANTEAYEIISKQAQDAANEMSQTAKRKAS